MSSKRRTRGQGRVFQRSEWRSIPEGAEVFGRDGEQACRFKREGDRFFTECPVRVRDGALQARVPFETWSIRWTTTEGKRREEGGFATKTVAESALKAQLDEEAQIRAGVLTRAALDRKFSLDEPIGPLAERCHQFCLESKAKRRADTLRSALAATLDAMGAKTLGDLSTVRVNRALGAMAKTAAPHTLRVRRTAVSMFGEWIAGDGGLLEASPVLGLARIKGGVKRHRDAFDLDEQRALLTAAATLGRYGRDRAGSISWRLDGPTRALLYQTAIETGLRASELRAMTVGDLRLSDRPCIILAGEKTKNKQGARLPLRPGLAAKLKARTSRMAPAMRVFDMPPVDRLATMIRADLAMARAAWIAEAEKQPMEQKRREQSDRFLPVRHNGWAVDFHSLRVTLASNLGRAGANPVQAKALMRHSSITLTIDLYTRLGFNDLADALDVLPDLDSLVGDSKGTVLAGASA